MKNKAAANNRTTRRSFLKQVSWAGGARACLPAVLGPLVRAASPNGKLNHACIGVGGMGWGDLQNLAAHPRVRIAALCDVDGDALARAKSNHPDAATYEDWRLLLEGEGDKFDSCNVSVPDHMHAIIALHALRLGKHIYCQKPLCHDVAEARALTRAAAEHPGAGLVTQIGTQLASAIGNRMAVEYLKRGAIGAVKRVVLCANRPGIEHLRAAGPRPSHADPVPAQFNWDLWLGTAPHRPFVSEVYHPKRWRAWQDFGTGWAGDMGCHILSAPWKGLGLTAPRTVTAEVQESWAQSPTRRSEVWPQSQHITWVFPGNDKTDGDLTLEWFDGEFYPPPEIRAMAQTENYPAEAAMFIGTQGAMLLPHGGSAPRLLPAERFKDHPRVEVAGQNHWHNFVEACLGAEQAESPFAMAGPMTEAVLLATVAAREPGIELEWDAATMRFPNHPQADRHLSRAYREGWHCPGLG